MGIWSWFRRKPQRPARAHRLRPPDWNRTIDDLMAEKRTISGEEIEWARSYERDQLRAWVRFPRNAEIYEALRDVEVNYLVHWQAPYTGGGTGTVHQGTRVRVSVGDRDPQPISVYADPLDGGELERRLVSEDERGSKKYGGFSLCIGVGELNKDFRLVK